jgi:hypothetical protein
LLREFFATDGPNIGTSYLRLSIGAGPLMAITHLAQPGLLHHRAHGKIRTARFRASRVQPAPDAAQRRLSNPGRQARIDCAQQRPDQLAFNSSHGRKVELFSLNKNAVGTFVW